MQPDHANVTILPVLWEDILKHQSVLVYHIAGVIKVDTQRGTSWIITLPSCKQCDFTSVQSLVKIKHLRDPVDK